MATKRHHGQGVTSCVETTLPRLPETCHRRQVAGRQLSQLHLCQPRRWWSRGVHHCRPPITTMAPTTPRQGRSLVLTRDGLGLAWWEVVFLTRGSSIHFSTLFLAAISLLTRAHWPPCVTRACSISPLAMPGGYRCKTQPTRRQRHASVDSLARHRTPRRCHARPKQLDRSHQGRIETRLRPAGPRPDPDSTAIRTSVPAFLCSFVRHGPLFVSSWETIAVCTPASWPLFRAVVYCSGRPIACIAKFRWRC